MSHQALQDAVGLSEVTRSSTGESPGVRRRKHADPTAQQVDGAPLLPKLCRLPLYLLVDDAVSVQDIESFDGL